MHSLFSMASNESPATICSECITAKQTKLPQIELTESICIALGDPLSGLEVTPFVLRPHTQLIVNNYSPFYSKLGYKVTQTYRNSARLLSIGSIDLQLLGRDVHLTPISEVGGILLRLPIDAIIDKGDMLYLLSIFRSPGNTPLVTSFTYQDCSEYQHHVVIVLTYTLGQLTFLSEPDSVGERPVKETMSIQLESGGLCQSRMMFFREECFRGKW